MFIFLIFISKSSCDYLHDSFFDFLAVNSWYKTNEQTADFFANTSKYKYKMFDRKVFKNYEKPI